MQSRDSLTFTAPHQYPQSYIRRYYEFLMQKTYEDPVATQKLIKIIGAAGVALMASPALSAMFEVAVPRSLSTAAASVGILAATGAGFSWFIQNYLFGAPIDKSKVIYQPDYYTYQSAKATLTCEEGYLPKLTITANTHYDAGYAEGMILAPYLHECVKKSKVIYLMICTWLKAPYNSDKLFDFIAPVLAKIPTEYLEEMQGKVEAYNTWLINNRIDAKPLTLEYYFTLQLLPDFHNFNPFKKNASTVSEVLPACTTFAVRSGDYLAFGRVLDWPSYGFAGYYFLQIERAIKGKLTSNDITIPLLTGALTIRNEANLLMEMNISHGDHVFSAQGIPATFYNRFCADSVHSLAELASFVDNYKPLSAYHLTATDGDEVISYHFYQNNLDKNKHHADQLATIKDQPQLLATANEGLHHFPGKNHIHNHNDSSERKHNLAAFFSHVETNAKLMNTDVNNLKDICLQMARLPLINNPGSVLAAFFIFHHKELVDASIATDNAYAANHELSEFKRLSY